MKHPSDDILLAYVRNQQDRRQDALQDHLTTCIACSRRCAELRSTGYIIESWAEDYKNDATYALVSRRVLRTLATPPTRARSTSRTGIHLSVVVVVIAFFLLVFVGLTAHLTGTFASPTSMWGPFPLLPSHKATPTTGLQTPSAQSTMNTGRASHPSIATTCTSAEDVKKHHLHICGSNFTPGSSVEIKYTLPNGKVKRHNAQVGKDGTFIDTLRINSCGDIPGTIDAANTQYSAEKVQFKLYIEFGHC